jgi:hypothetical protein
VRLRRGLGAHVQALAVLVDGIGAEVAGHRTGREISEPGFDRAIDVDELLRQVAIGRALGRAGLAWLTRAQCCGYGFERVAVALELNFQHLAAVEGAGGLRRIVGGRGEDRQNTFEFRLIVANGVARDMARWDELQCGLVPGRLLRRARRRRLRGGGRGQSEQYSKSDAYAIHRLKS